MTNSERQRRLPVPVASADRRRSARVYLGALPWRLHVACRFFLVFGAGLLLGYVAGLLLAMRLVDAFWGSR